MVRLLLWIAFLILLAAVIYIASRNTVNLEQRLVGSGILALAAFVAWFVYSPSLKPVERRFTAFFETDEMGVPTGVVRGLTQDTYTSRVIQPLATTMERLRSEGPGNRRDGYWQHYVPSTQANQALMVFDSETWLEYVVFSIQHRIFRVSRPQVNEVSWSAQRGVVQTEALSTLREMETEAMIFQNFLRVREGVHVWNSLNLDIGSSEMLLPKGIRTSIVIETADDKAIIKLDSNYAKGIILIQRGISLQGSFVQFQFTCQASFPEDYKMSTRAQQLHKWFTEIFESLPKA